MDLIKVSQLDPSTEITENDLIMVVREINGTKYSFKTNVKSLLDKVNYDLATDVTGKPALVGAQNTDYMPIIRKVGQSVTAYKITTEELVKLSKFDFPKTVNDSSSLSTLEDTDLIAIVRNETNGGTVRKINYKDFKDLVGKVKTVQNFEPDENGNIQISRKNNFVAESSYLVLNLDPKNMIERYEASFTDPNKSVRIEVDLRSFTTVAYAKELLENYVAQLVLRNEIDAKGITLRFRNGPNGYVFYQGQKVLLNTNIFLTGKSNILEFRIASDKVLHVANLSGGGVETVNDVAPDANNNVNVLARAPFSNNNPVPNWKGVGNFATATRSCSISLASGRPANFDMIGWCFEILVDTSFLTAQQQLTVTIDPKDVIWPDGTPMSAVTAENLFIYEKGEINKIRFTYASSGKFIIEDGRLGSSSINNLITGNATASAPVLNLYLNQLNLGGMGTLVYKPTQGVFTDAYFRLNKSNFIPSRIPTGWEFLFSVTMDKNSTWVENSIPVIMELGDSFEKLYDSQLRQVDRYKYITADRGVVKWYKLRYVRSVGFVVSREFVSSIQTVNGAEADGNNDVKISKPATTLISSGGTSQTYKPNFKGLIDTLIIYPGQQSISATIDLTFPTGEFPPTGWCLNIVLDTLSGEDGGQQSSTSTASISWKTNTGYIVNSSAALVKNSEASLSASWSRKSYIDVIHLGNGIFKITNTYPGALYKAYSATRHQTQVITFKPSATSLVETWAAGLLDVGITQNVILDLDDIVRVAQPGYRFIFRVSNVVYVINGTGVVTPQGTIPDQNRFELANNKTYECVKVPNAPGSLAQNGPTVIIKDIGHFSDKKKTTVYASNKLAEIVFDTSENQVHEYRLNAGSGETFAIKLADAVGPANDDWEAILSMDTYLVNTSTLRILGGNAVFDGEVRANTDTSAILFERFMPQNRERRIKVTRPSAARGGWIFTTLNPMHGKKSVNITTNGFLSFRPDYGIDEDIVYCAALTGSTFTIDIKDWDYTKLPMNYKVRVFINANSNAKLVFNSQSIYNGESKGQTIIDVSGLNVFDLLNIGYGVPMIVKVG